MPRPRLRAPRWPPAAEVMDPEIAVRSPQTVASSSTRPAGRRIRVLDRVRAGLASRLVPARPPRVLSRPARRASAAGPVAPSAVQSTSAGRERTSGSSSARCEPASTAASSRLDPSGSSASTMARRRPRGPGRRRPPPLGAPPSASRGPRRGARPPRPSRGRALAPWARSTVDVLVPRQPDRAERDAPPAAPRSGHRRARAPGSAQGGRHPTRSPRRAGGRPPCRARSRCAPARAGGSVR